MLSKSLKFLKIRETYLIKNFSSLIQHTVPENNVEISVHQSISSESISPRKESVLEKCTEDLSDIAPYTKPSFNFAAYVDKSETLQELLKLGVNLHKLEKKVFVPPIILGLVFEKDIKPIVTFLHDLGLPVEDMGVFFTKNPFIFKEELSNVEARINYLYFKKFTKDMVLRIISSNPHWLNFNIPRIDKRLGFFQNYFTLSGDEVRKITVKQPKLITYNLNHIKLNKFVIREEMGFDDNQLKEILMKKPKIFMKSQDVILKTFEYVHNNMGISHDLIVKIPEILTFGETRIRNRHIFLEKLGKAQFDPNKPGYISLISLAGGSDENFCDEVAKTSVQSFNVFLKTL